MSRKISLVIYTILHLLTDGICAHAVVNYLYANNSNSAIIIFFLYNFIALCTQPILGLIVDKFQKKEIIYETLAAISIILVIIGSFLTNNWIISTMMMGFGNGLLYVVGGKETVHRSNNKLLPLSLYVSFGAMGVFLGTNITNIIILHIFRLLSVICVIVLFILPNQFKFKENKEVFIEKRTHKFFILIPLILAVFLRGFVNEVLITDMLDSFWDLFILTLCGCLGKILGGYLVDKIGFKITIYLSMGIFTILCTVFPYNQMALYIGVICFNMSMPMTLYRYTKMYPNYEAFAFGFAAALTLPAYLLGYSCESILRQDMVNYLLVILFLGLLNIIFLRTSSFKWLQRFYKN